ncbi:MAG: glycine zipper 2TM domain-containing protein [Xanthomonadales bacterium]|nr:glycine zipper 2TM domain-containing protein [Xanthomonadales bacterium]
MRTVLSSLMLASVLVPPAMARSYDWAPVVRVEPVVVRERVPVSEQVCRSEPVTVVERRRSDERAAAILGAIIGGVIGNQFGRGDGRDAATAAGALLGYHAVRDSQRRADRYYGGGVRYVEHRDVCSYETTYELEERIVGYDVTYRYNGRLYTTRTSHHPGSRIRVVADVRPADW